MRGVVLDYSSLPVASGELGGGLPVVRQVLVADGGVVEGYGVKGRGGVVFREVEVKREWKERA